jgi:inner membrane transporter RhtA
VAAPDSSLASSRSPTVLRAVWLVLAGIMTVQFGSGLAKTLFEDASATSVVWLRLVASALILLAVARPVLRGRSGHDWLVVAGLGVSLGVMNWSFYQSIQRIPLGLAVTIEFVGPLALSLFGSRRARDLAWVALAAVGVVLLGVEPGELTVAGVAFALLAGTSWAAYILMSAQTGRRWPGLDGLAVASVMAAVLIAPPVVLGGHLGELLDVRLLLLGTVVALLSSVIPYGCEMVALRTLRPAVFGILMSLEPAAAALAGLIVLGEVLGGAQLLAIACVVVASVGATRSHAVIAEPVPD